MGQKILLVEDDQPTRLLIEECLGMNGYEVHTAEDGKSALAMLAQEDYTLVLLDVMLEDIDGFTLCEKIRQDSIVPIIMVTAKNESESIVKALNIGADDYIVKPFNTKELLARIAAVIRRSAFREENNTKTVLRVGQLAMDFSAHRVMVGDREVRLTPTEFKLLAQMAGKAGTVLNHRQLLKAVWGPEYINDTHYLRVCIGRIRNKLNIPEGEPGYIRTVPTIGYMVIA